MAGNTVRFHNMTHGLKLWKPHDKIPEGIYPVLIHDGVGLIKMTGERVLSVFGIVTPRLTLSPIINWRFILVLLAHHIREPTCGLKECPITPLGESPNDKEGGSETEKSPALTQERIKSWPAICFSPHHTVVVLHFCFPYWIVSNPLPKLNFASFFLPCPLQRCAFGLH